MVDDSLPTMAITGEGTGIPDDGRTITFRVLRACGSRDSASAIAQLTTPV